MYYTVLIVEIFQYPKKNELNTASSLPVSVIIVYPIIAMPDHFEQLFIHSSEQMRMERC